MKLLLIYPFGSSDFQLPTVPTSGPETVVTKCGKPRDTIKDKLAQWIGTEECEWDFSGSQHRLVWRVRGGPEVSNMPILGDTLSRLLWPNGAGPATSVVPVVPHTATLLRDSDVRSIALKPILTEQKPPHENDTCQLLPVLRRLEAFWCGHDPKFELLDPWLVSVDPWDYAAMTDFYRRVVYPDYAKLVKAGSFTRVFVQVTPGTPAMSLAASVFAQDATVEFLYTPNRRRTATVQLFNEERRRSTDNLVVELMRRHEWGAAARVLGQAGNGYTPLVGPHPRSADISRLRRLDAWAGRRFDELMEPDPLSTSNMRSDEEALSRIARHLCDGPQEDLARAPIGRETVSPGSSDDVLDEERYVPGQARLEFPETLFLAALDGYNRLCAAWALGDQADALMAAFTINDNCLLWALSILGEEDPGNVLVRRSEPLKLQRLFERIGYLHTEPLWVGPFLRLQWTLTTCCRDLRNMLAHSAVHLPLDVITNSLRPWIALPDGLDGLDVLAALAGETVQAVSGGHDAPCPVLTLSDSLLPLADQKMPALLELHRKAAVVAAAVDDGRKKHSTSLKDLLDRNAALVMGEFRLAVQRDDCPDDVRSAVLTLEVCDVTLTTESSLTLYSHRVIDYRNERPHAVRRIVAALGARTVLPFCQVAAGNPVKVHDRTDEWLRGGAFADLVKYGESVARAR